MTEIRKCDRCKKSPIEEHHLHPRFMDNKKGDGMKIWLCKKHHDILHQIIPCIIWNFVPESSKEKCIKAIINFTNKYGNLKNDKTNI